jgi:hypothetical protein
MREKLNDNPMAQVAVVGMLLFAVVVFFMTSKGGGSEEEESAATTTPAVAVEASEGSLAALPAPGTGPGALPPLPRPVVKSFSANDTVVLLFVRNGGIDDRMVAADVRTLSSLPDVANFVIPVSKISRYAAITQGVQLNRVPALLVLRPKHLAKGIPTGSVYYGYQSPESVEQAVIDAGYKGPTVPYHP